MSRKLIALDWNGTPFDDVEPHVRAVNEVYAEIGMAPIDVPTYQEHFEIPIINYLARLGVDPEWFRREEKRLAVAFHRAVDFYSRDSKLRDGVPEFLSWAATSENNITVTIVSNHIRSLIGKELERHGISQFFNAASIIANDESHEISLRRSKGDKLADYIAREGIAGNDVIIVGDTAEEADMARAIGGHSALITGGYNSERRLREANPTMLVHSFPELQRELGVFWNLG